MSNEPKSPIPAATTITVQRTVKPAGKPETSESKTETIEVHQFATQPAMSAYSMDVKMNVCFGNGASVFVSVSRPSYTEEIPDAIAFAKATVLAQIKAELPDLEKVVERLGRKKAEIEGRVNGG